MSKDHNTVTCSHGKGLACPVCYVQPTSKSACIASRASELNLPHVDVSEGELPRKPVRDIPKYMFAERPVTFSTWLELTSAQLDTYMLSDGTALLVDPQNREYCYVFWDEAEQCSNPYPNHAEAVMARTVYIANL